MVESRFTLKDSIVQDAILASSTLPSVLPRVKLIVVGGMAVQLYNSNPDLYRPTIDVDLVPTNACGEGVSTADFRNLVVPHFAANIRPASGYEMTTAEKARYGFEMGFRRDADPFAFFTHINAFTPAYLGRHSSWKQREISNALSIVHPLFPGVEVSVYRPEDVVTNKMRRLRRLRSMGYLSERDGGLVDRLMDGDIEYAAEKDLVGDLAVIQGKRSAILGPMSHYGSAEWEGMMDEYKTSKDLFDVAVIAQEASRKSIDFDKRYFRDSVRQLPEAHHSTH